MHQILECSLCISVAQIFGCKAGHLNAGSHNSLFDPLALFVNGDHTPIYKFVEIVHRRLVIEHEEKSRAVLKRQLKWKNCREHNTIGWNEFALDCGFQF